MYNREEWGKGRPSASAVERRERRVRKIRERSLPRLSHVPRARVPASTSIFVCFCLLVNFHLVFSVSGVGGGAREISIPMPVRYSIHMCDIRYAAAFPLFPIFHLERTGSVSDKCDWIVDVSVVDAQTNVQSKRASMKRGRV